MKSEVTVVDNRGNYLDVYTDITGFVCIDGTHSYRLGAYKKCIATLGKVYRNNL